LSYRLKQRKLISLYLSRGTLLCRTKRCPEPGEFHRELTALDITIKGAAQKAEATLQTGNFSD
jgi:hypothetical protein